MDVEREDESAWGKRRTAESKRIERIALELCLERGVDDVTIEEIATVAGIARRTFYRYFNTIDDILTASPRRMIGQIVDAVRERPASENIREAFVNAAPGFVPSEEDKQLQVLGVRVSRRCPAAMPRAIGRIQPMINQAFEELVVERLAGAGRDATYAPLISSVLIAVITDVADKTERDGEFTLTPVDLDAALKAIALAIAP